MHASANVDLYIEGLPDEEKWIAEKLRELIFEIIPNAEERFSFKIPFYHYFGMFCYINRLKAGGVELAFCRGKDLILAFPELHMNGRAMIAGISIRQLHQMDSGLVRSILSAAAEWQEEAFKAGKPFIQTGKSKNPGMK